MNEPHPDARIGYAEADITPPGPAELVGFARPDNTSKGVLHPLLAQVLLWKNLDEHGCLITIDSLGFTVELSNQLRERVAAEFDTTPDRVMLCFSHTHAAPNAATSAGYYPLVCERILEAARKASTDCAPVNAAWGIGANTIGINRRGDPKSMDERLGILKLTNPVTHTLKVLLLRVTAHANVLTSDNYLISADYVGVTRDLLQKRYGCHVMLVQGAAGDIRPKYQQENAEYLEIHGYEAAQQAIGDAEKATNFSQSLRALDHMAAEIDRAVAQVLDGLTPQPIRRLGMGSTRTRLVADVPDLERAYAIAEEAGREAGIDGTNWIGEVKRLHGDHVRQQASDIEIQYLFVNEGCICGVANEIMCRLALDVRAMSGDELLFLNGYTNGCNSYLPSAEEYDKGGYEVLWSNLIYYPYHGRVMPFNRSAADVLVNEVVRHWKEYAETDAGTARPK